VKRTRVLKGGKNSPNWGTHPTEEVLERLSRIHIDQSGYWKDREIPLETREEISKSLKGNIPHNLGKRSIVEPTGMGNRYRYITMIPIKAPNIEGEDLKTKWKNGSLTCPRCQSHYIRKAGWGKGGKSEGRQKYRCHDCKRTFRVPKPGMSA